MRRLAETIREARPDIQVHLRSKDNQLGSWARLALAPMGMLCNPSTFCFWPCLGSTNGLFVDSPLLIPDTVARPLTTLLPGFRIVTQPRMVSYRTAHDRGGERTYIRSGKPVRASATLPGDCPADHSVHADLVREAGPTVTWPSE